MPRKTNKEKTRDKDGNFNLKERSCPAVHVFPCELKR